MHRGYCDDMYVFTFCPCDDRVYDHVKLGQNVGRNAIWLVSSIPNLKNVSKTDTTMFVAPGMSAFRMLKLKCDVFQIAPAASASHPISKPVLPQGIGALQHGKNISYMGEYEAWWRTRW
jgi:hypothetical protein